MYQNILVAVDGSEHGFKAAHVAGDMARCMQADLYVITVYDPIPDYLGQPNLQDALVKRMQFSEQVVEQALKEVGEVPAKLSSETLEGPVAEAILKVIEARQIDLVIMGTRGLGRLAACCWAARARSGAARACPVLLVR